MQRVKVGLIGLAAVVLLIALASAIIGSASRDRVDLDAGQGNAATAAAALNDSLQTADEPLAEMGVAPSAANLQDADAAPPR